MTTSDTAPARKYRSRKQKPCDNCRSRRVCCVRDAEGDCALCSRRSIPCTFSSKPSPRTRHSRPETEVRRQQSRNDGTEAIQRPTPDHPTGSSTSIQNASDKYGVPERRRDAGEANYIGLTGTEDVYFATEREQGIGNDPAREAYFRDRPRSSVSVSSNDSAHRPRPIEPHASIVQTIFLERSHPAYPLLDESRVRDPEQSRMLTSAIAIISKYTSPELEGLHNNVLIEGLTSSLLLEARSPTLETVEAAILFTQRALRGKMSTSAPGMWAVIGALVGMCHDLGLNVDPSAWSIPDQARKRRKRIWWAAYMQDKWFAMALGRPSFMNAANTTTAVLTAADFEEASDDLPSTTPKRPELVTGIHCFVAFSELTVILDEILSIFFTIGSVVSLREASAEQIIDIADKIDAKLDAFSATYLDQILTQRFFPDVTGSLELAYITVRIMLLRGVFPKLYRRSVSLDRYLENAIDMTTRVISLVERLQINRLCSFWWSCSGFNFALAGTFMGSLKRLSPDPERASYWDNRLKYYRRLLSAHGVSFWPAKFAAAALDQMAKNLTKVGIGGHVGGRGGGAASVLTDETNGSETVDPYNITPSTPWSGVSYDFLPHHFSNAGEPDFMAEWWGPGEFVWQQQQQQQQQ